MAQQKSQPTIKEIAVAAGVSVATVSNVLSGRRQIESDAGRRVVAIAKKMGYTRAQKSRLRKTIRFIVYKKHGLVIMDTPFFSELIAGIERECQRRKYELVISYILMDADDAKERLQTLLSDRSTAILLLATEMDDEDIEPFLNASVPVLSLDNFFHGQRINSVVMNNVSAGIQATRFLIENGHREIGFIGSSIAFSNMADRFKGYRTALEGAGLSYEKSYDFRIEPTMEGAYRDMKLLLDKHTEKLPTAFFAANDILAVGAARAMKDCGLYLPRDASIVGMDDMPVCQVVNPTLSTISVPKAGIGAAAVNRLIQMIEENDDLIIKSQVDVHLVKRDSVIANTI